MNCTEYYYKLREIIDISKNAPDLHVSGYLNAQKEMSRCAELIINSMRAELSEEF